MRFLPLLFLSTLSAFGLTNGFNKPFIGWNGFGYYHKDISSVVVSNAAWTSHTNGLQAAASAVGADYYIDIDAYWSDGTTNSLGVPNPDATKFPGGIKEVADYVHSLGMKFGLYCQGWHTGEDTDFTEGIDGYETNAVNQFAAWGVDYLEYDFVHNDKQAHTTLMKNAVMSCGRPMIFASDQFPVQAWSSMVVNYARTTDDPDGSWASVLTSMNDYNSQSVYATNGFWPDPALLAGGYLGSTMTATEARSQFALWCVMGAKLERGDSGTNINAASLSFLTNTELLAINQDGLLQPGTRRFRTAGIGGNLDVGVKPITNGVAVWCFNGSTITTNITFDFTTFGLSNTTAVVRDVVSRTNCGFTVNTYTATSIASHDTAVFTLLNLTGPTMTVGTLNVGSAVFR